MEVMKIKDKKLNEYTKPKLEIHGDLKKITAGPPNKGQGDAIYDFS